MQKAKNYRSVRRNNKLYNYSVRFEPDSLIFYRTRWKSQYNMSIKYKKMNITSDVFPQKFFMQ